VRLRTVNAAGVGTQSILPANQGGERLGDETSVHSLKQGVMRSRAGRSTEVAIQQSGNEAFSLYFRSYRSVFFKPF